jgi:hypothetical protein
MKRIIKQIMITEHQLKEKNNINKSLVDNINSLRIDLKKEPA